VAISRKTGTRMNRALADAVGFLKGFLAIILVIVCTLAGAAKGGAVGAALGFVAGDLAAIIVCGLVAVAIDIRNTLHSINDHLAKITSRIAR
jgi:hypothetical protein